MTDITPDMRGVIRRAMLSYVATINEDGSPNLSPKATVMPYDDEHLVFMDQASPGTMANLRRDPRVEINSIDVFRRRGYRFKGKARIIPPGDPVYEWLKQKVIEMVGPGYPANEAVLMDIEGIRAVDSPAYQFGDAAEQALARAYAARYIEAAGLAPDDLATRSERR